MSAGSTGKRAPLRQRFDSPPSGPAGSATDALDPRLAPILSGAARLEPLPDALRLTVGPASAGTYCNAQVDDYHRQRARAYPWRPPLRLRVRARASSPAWPASRTPTDAPGEADAKASAYLRGTAGFGFWNASLSGAGGALRPPEALWFFAASPPSNMALTPGVPGYGWKAQAVHARRLGALGALGPMAATALWARLSGDERAAARWLNRLSGAREAPLDAETASLRDWHGYEIEWRAEVARYRVDGYEVLTVPNPPRGPLGLVIWIDTQYAVATPRGDLRFGALATSEQWLELAEVSVEPL